MPPTLSALCVTKNRPHHLGWLAWNLSKQTRPADEVIVVDTSEPINRGHYDIFPEGTKVIHEDPDWVTGQSRQRALDESTGDYVTWYDDDDWLHPQKNEWLLQLMDDPREPLITHLAGGCWIWRLHGKSKLAYSLHRHGLDSIPCVFPAMMFRGDLARQHAFQPELAVAEDTKWKLAILGKHDWKPKVAGRMCELAYGIVVHGHNTHQKLDEIPGGKKLPKITAWGEVSGDEWERTLHELAKII